MIKPFMLVACLLTLSLATVRAHGDPPPSDAGGFSIKVGLKENAAAFRAGEPVMVHYQINAPDNRSVGFVRGNWNTAWYEVSVRDKQGKVVPAFKDSRPPYRAGVSPVLYKNTVPCKQKIEGDINLRRLVDLSEKGDYVLTFTIKARFILLDGWREYLENEDHERLEHEASVYKAEVKLPFSLTEPDQEKLRRQAIVLRDKIRNAPDQWVAEDLADELFTLPETVAYPQGRHLVAEGVQSQAVARALARTHNKSAVDLLVVLGKQPMPLSAQGCEWHIAGLLRELRGVVEPELRQYIDDALAKNEKRFQPGVLVID